MAQISKISSAYGFAVKCRKATFCRAIDMDRSYMSAIESGKKNVTVAVVEKLARALNGSVDEFLK